jgi:drug/metabolite transporter (DMT)-like permease
VSLHAVWIAAAGLAVLAVVVEGPGAVLALDAGDLLAAAHLAVVVTAVAFLLWYSAVRRMGAGRAGLFTGVVPVAAAAGGVLLGGAAPAPAVWVGTAVVGAGLVLGLRVSPGAGSPTTSAAPGSP